MDQPPTGKKREVIAALAVLIVIVAIVSGATLSAHKQTADQLTANATPSASPTDTATGNTSTTDSTSSSTGTTTSNFKDGTYNATGYYDSPDGTEAITISVTLQNGVITATSAQSGAQDPDAAEYQDLFISGYKQQVVGKSITSVHLNRVSGSSLTSQGFNSAIQKIEQQAQNA